MLTRRHIRVKVMQVIYALLQSKDNSLEQQQKFLGRSMHHMHTLYLFMISLLAQLHQLAQKHSQHATKKYLATAEDHYPLPEKFVHNRLLLQIADNTLLQDTLAQKKINPWYLNEEYVKLLYKDIVASAAYQTYMADGKDTYENDKHLVLELFKTTIAPNEKLYEYLEDEQLTWADDMPIVNTCLLKRLRKAQPSSPECFFLPPLLKAPEDGVYAQDLLVKTLVNNAQWEEDIAEKTPNWDKSRIAPVDFILLKMALCELVHFPSIPEKVTLNEYLEIAKEYSTPKSSIFINGILDKLAKEYKAAGKLQKIGRGLQ